MKLAMVGAPQYFARHPPPRTPDDLVRHRCIEYRRNPDGSPFEWLLSRHGQSRQLAVEGQVTVNSPELIVRAAVDGLGIAYALEARAEPFLRSGQLIRVLEEWAPSFEGLFLYYPGHRQVPAALRALIEMIRAERDANPPDSLAESLFAANW
jgi:DNA-binding transcriptional LysR family regulator